MKIVRILFFLIVLSACSHDREYWINDIELFKYSRAWELAKVVNRQDTDAIRRIVKKDSTLLRETEDKFGATVLFWAVVNKKLDAAKTLLRLGADPNIRCKDGESMLMNAAAFDNPNFLVLLMQYGAIVNDTFAVDDSPHDTPLKAACITSLENVKILVEAGADVNYAKAGYIKPVGDAAIQDKLDIVQYLLAHGADAQNPIWVVDTVNWYLHEVLENKEYALASKDDKMRKEILKLLGKKTIGRP